MELDDSVIANPSSVHVPPKWLPELKATYRATAEVLEELRQDGFSWKDVAEVVLGPRGATWEGIDEKSGRVLLAPASDHPRTLAHEMGHGFDELWRLRPNHKCCGEAMAEAIRYFVEELMGNRNWQPDSKWTSVLDACSYKLDIFKTELDGKIAQLG